MFVNGASNHIWHVNEIDLPIMTFNYGIQIVHHILLSAQSAMPVIYAR